MRCQGDFIFKTLTHRDGGAFKNDNGDTVNYKSAYILKVDERLDNGDIQERKFKIAENKTSLINFLKDVETYAEIILTFNLNIYNTRIILDLIDVNYPDD